MLTRDQILNANDIHLEEIDVPEWGGTVYVRVISGQQRDIFEAKYAKLRENPLLLKDMRAHLAVMTLCDESGARLFEDKDIQALSQKSALALDRVFDAALRLNKLDASAVDEAKKNSENGLSIDSGSS